MLDHDLGIGWHGESLVLHLDSERITCLQRISEPAQGLHKLCGWNVLFNIAICHRQIVADLLSKVGDVTIPLASLRQSAALTRRSGRRVIENHQRLQIAVELEGVIATFTTNAGDTAPTKRRREISHQERVDPHES